MHFFPWFVNSIIKKNISCKKAATILFIIILCVNPLHFYQPTNYFYLFWLKVLLNNFSFFLTIVKLIFFWILPLSYILIYFVKFIKCCNKKKLRDAFKVSLNWNFRTRKRNIFILVIFCGASSFRDIVLNKFYCCCRWSLIPKTDFELTSSTWIFR